MKEIRVLIYTLIRDYPDYLTLTGGNSQDPRFYWQYTPQQIITDHNKPGYSVYYRSGTVRTGYKVNIAQKDDQIYMVEIYGKEPGTCDDIGDCLVELFREKSFSTLNYNVLFAYGNVLGSPQFDNGRNLFTLNTQIYMTKIMKK